MSILDLNTLALDLVAKDFSDGHAPHNGGPTKTSRALAIIHLAARDAYAVVTGSYPPRLQQPLPPKPDGVGSSEEEGISAALGAGVQACRLLYRDFSSFIIERAADFTSGANPKALRYGYEIAERWIASRHNDKSSLPQLDWMYRNEPGHHRPDPISKAPTLGRNWGQVIPFILENVTDVHLKKPPELHSVPYGKAYDDVFVNGRDNIIQRNPKYQHHAAIGIFWGYDGSNKIGTPPRLYNQVVVKCDAFPGSKHAAAQLNVLAAINAAMADAGIAAWYWKYQYDVWRPVVAIREADKGFGPTGAGDGNKHRSCQGDPFWKPLGAPRSNPIPPLKSGAEGDNFTPNFPSYPSGHATFGSACFKTFARLVNKELKDIKVIDFVSDEFNGLTTDNAGAVRPVWKQSFSLEAAIDQNDHSRVYLGVHWDFDVTYGHALGMEIAERAARAFTPHH